MIDTEKYMIYSDKMLYINIGVINYINVIE